MSLRPPALVLPALFLLVQLGLMTLPPPAIRGPAAYGVVLAAPLGAAAAAFWRAWRERAMARLGWGAMSLSLLAWSVGAFSNLWHELVLENTGLMYRDATLAFNLAIVPLVFLLASEWRVTGSVLVRWIDALMALALGTAYFLVTWLTLTARGAPDEASVVAMIWLLDAQNLYLAVGAALRWRASEERDERDLFAAMAAYGWVYLVLCAINNHGFAPNPSFGPEYSTIITPAFVVMAAMALSAAPRGDWALARPAFVHWIRSASPILLAGALLMVSLVLIRTEYLLGALGILVAVLGHGLRSTLAQVGHIVRGDSLLRAQSELQSLAITDAVTGIANRHYLHQALDSLWRVHRRNGGDLSALMIDIDHFKQFNDRYGHPAGDACLREVASALQGALVRPADVLVRYGGEEFIALLPDADASAAGVVAERLRGAVQALGIEHAGSPHAVVTVSVGAASTQPQGLPTTITGMGGTPTGAATLIQAADRALYRAKQVGRNCVMF